jgi:hypothetical protein
MRSFLKFRFRMGAHVLHAYRPGRHSTHRFFGDRKREWDMYVASWRAQTARSQPQDLLVTKKHSLLMDLPCMHNHDAVSVFLSLNAWCNLQICSQFSQEKQKKFLHVHVTRLHWLLLSDVCGRTSLLVSGDLMPSSTCKVHYCWILQRRFFKCPAVPAVHGSSSKVKETLLIHFLWRKKLIQLVMIVLAFSRYSHLVRYSTNMTHNG